MLALLASLFASQPVQAAPVGGAASRERASASHRRTRHELVRTTAVSATNMRHRPRRARAASAAGAVTVPGLAVQAGMVRLTVALPSPGPASVEYLVDGVRAGTALSAGAGYPYAWNTNAVADGRHSVVARYVNASGVLLTTAPTSITTSNHVVLGTALGLDVLTDPNTRYPATFISDFGSMTPEHEMKWVATEPQPGSFTFQAADSMVNWALGNGKSVHGHNLVWYDSLPSWLTDGTWTRTQLLSILQRHITTVVSHFKGRVTAWDVVNEPLNQDGTLMTDLFERIIGPEYIADSLRWAHAADPNALLYINEYGTETINAKSNALFALAKSLIAAGVPLNGVGFQMHVSTSSYPTASQLALSMQRFADLGLRTDVTEMDVKTSTTSGTPMGNPLDAEAAAYGQAANGCALVPACTHFTTWGISDELSWLGSAQQPLMFDTSYQPKPAYGAVLNGLRTRR